MEIRQLKNFVAIAEEGNFTRAAARVNIVQSALSTSIRQLEEELGSRLFARTTRKVTLTIAGEVFLDKARAALDAISSGRDAVADTIGLRRGRLAIGTAQSLPAFVELPAILAQFHALYPNIEVRMLQGSTQSLIDMVRNKQIDMAILPITEEPEELATTLVVCEDMMLACPRNHPFANREMVSIAELAGETFVEFESAFGTRKLVDAAFNEAGLERRISFEVSDLITQLELVIHGLGVALVPQIVIETRGMELVGVPLDVEICWELVVVHGTNTRNDATNNDADISPATDAFLKLLKEKQDY